MAPSATAQGFSCLCHASLKTQACFGGCQILQGVYRALSISASALLQPDSFFDSAQYL